MTNKNYTYFNDLFIYVELDSYIVGNELSYYKYKFYSMCFFYIENNIFYFLSLFFSENIISLNYLKRYKSLFFFLLRANIFGNTKHLKLEGRGYKLYSYINSIILKLGYSHLCYFLLPVNVLFISRKKKLHYKLFSFSDSLIGNLLYRIQSFRVPNTYKKKGIFIT